MYRKFLLAAILGCMLCGFTVAEDLRFLETIRIEGTVRQAAGDGAPVSYPDFPVVIYLVKSPDTLSQPYDAKSVKWITTVHTDSGGHFSYTFTNDPGNNPGAANDMLGYLVVMPQLPGTAGTEKPGKFELVTATASPDFMVKQQDSSPIVIFSVLDMWKKQTSEVDASLVWKATFSSLASKNSPGNTTIQGGLSSPSVSPFREVTGCGKITEPGYYILKNDIIVQFDSPNSCIEIEAPDVALNGNNKRLQGSNYEYSSGIHVNKNNVTISNINISGWSTGIEYTDCSEGLINNSDVWQNPRFSSDQFAYHLGGSPWHPWTSSYYPGGGSLGAGIALYNISKTQVINTKITENNIGIIILHGHDNLVGGLPPCGNNYHEGFWVHAEDNVPSEYFQNVIERNHIGILLDDTKHNQIVSNAISENGIEMWWDDLYGKGKHWEDHYLRIYDGSPNHAWNMNPAGIYLTGSDDNEIKLNTVYRNFGDGVIIDGSKNNRIFANKIKESYNNGIQFREYSYLGNFYKSENNLIHTNYLGFGVYRNNPRYIVKGIGYDNSNPPNKIFYNGSVISLGDIGSNSIFNNAIDALYPEKEWSLWGRTIQGTGNIRFYTLDKIPGSNIAGGPSIGGNFWITSQKPLPADGDNDGFYDTPFQPFSSRYFPETKSSANSIDRFPLVKKSDKMVYSNSLTGELCELARPDEILDNGLTRQGLARNENTDARNLPAFLNVPKSPVIIPPAVQEEVYGKKNGELKTPLRPFSIVDALISFPQTVISVLKGSGPESTESGSQDGTTATVILVRQEEPAPAATDSVKVVVPDEGKERGTDIVIVNDVVRPEVIISGSSSGAGNGDDSGTLGEARVVLPETTAGIRTEIAEGRTICPPDQRACSGVCRDVSSDRYNCGSCGFLCETGFVCTLGTCTPFCNSGLTSCNGACVSLQTDTSHCGSCGHTCLTGATCINGQCVAQMVTAAPTRLGGVGMRGL